VAAAAPASSTADLMEPVARRTRSRLLRRPELSGDVDPWNDGFSETELATLAEVLELFADDDDDDGDDGDDGSDARPKDLDDALTFFDDAFNGDGDDDDDDEDYDSDDDEEEEAEAKEGKAKEGEEKEEAHDDDDDDDDVRKAKDRVDAAFVLPGRWAQKLGNLGFDPLATEFDRLREEVAKAILLNGGVSTPAVENVWTSLQVIPDGVEVELVLVGEGPAPPSTKAGSFVANGVAFSTEPSRRPCRSQRIILGYLHELGDVEMNSPDWGGHLGKQGVFLVNAQPLLPKNLGLEPYIFVPLMNKFMRAFDDFFEKKAVYVEFGHVARVTCEDAIPANRVVAWHHPTARRPKPAFVDRRSPFLLAEAKLKVQGALIAGRLCQVFTIPATAGQPVMPITAIQPPGTTVDRPGRRGGTPPQHPRGRKGPYLDIAEKSSIPSPMDIDQDTDNIPSAFVDETLEAGYKRHKTPLGSFLVDVASRATEEPVVVGDDDDDPTEVRRRIIADRARKKDRGRTSAVAVVSFKSPNAEPLVVVAGSDKNHDAAKLALYGMATVKARRWCEKKEKLDVDQRTAVLIMLDAAFTANYASQGGLRVLDVFEDEYLARVVKFFDALIKPGHGAEVVIENANHAEMQLPILVWQAVEALDGEVENLEDWGNLDETDGVYRHADDIDISESGYLTSRACCTHCRKSNAFFDFPIRGTSENQNGLNKALNNQVFCRALDAYDPTFLSRLQTLHNSGVAGNMSYVSFGDQLRQAIRAASRFQVG